MRVLAIDSSGVVASVAVVEDDRVLAEYSLNDKKTHSQTLLPMIDNMFNMLSLDKKSLDAIVVAKGPGSFTGLRIGVSTAKGIALALNIPIIGVPTVDGLAYQLYDTEALVCPMMDARRNQVYTGLYRVKAGKLTIEHPQDAMDVNEMLDIINSKNEKVIFLGDGVPVYESIIKENLKCQYSFALPYASRQRAAALGALGIEYSKSGLVTDADDFKPDYLRASQAERERALFLKNINFRPMEKADCEQVAVLEAKAFAEPWSKKALDDSLDSGDYCFFVADRAGEVLAYCGYYVTADEANITNIVVHEEVRGKGIGHALMTHLIEYAYGSGLNAITLEVRVSNMSARNLYESLGFQLEGVRKNFYSAPTEDGCIYWLRK